jgi:hypothetical protein
LTVLLKQVKVVCLAQVGQRFRENSSSVSIIEDSLATVSAEAKVIMKLESPPDFLEWLELHGASIRELNIERQQEVVGRVRTIHQLRWWDSGPSAAVPFVGRV